MSLIYQVLGKLENIPKILKIYDEYLIDAESDLSLVGKSLEEACKEHASLQSYYYEKLCELKILLKYVESQLDKTKGELYKKYTENYSIKLATTEKINYIKMEPKYISMNCIYLEVEEIFEKFKAIVESFNSRGYMLNNITKARIAQIESTII